MSINNQDPVKGGGYTLPRHIFVRPANGADISDGHVAHPSGDPRYGLQNGQPVDVKPLTHLFGFASGGKV